MFNFKPRRSTATLSNESKTSISNQSRTSGESQREGKRTRSLSATGSHPDSILLHRNGNHSDGEDIVSTNTRRNSIGQQRTPLAYHNYGSSSSLTDALLPIEYPKTATVAKSANTPRPTRLRFALPDTPSRAKSPVLSKPAHKSSSKRRSKSPRKSRWLGNTSDSSDDEMVIPTVGAKVELLRRPLPTLGTIKYIGDVNFAKGTWVGIELESRGKAYVSLQKNEMS
jgi:hypothetical protein